jgi:SAM-dependent methyltransferase
VAGYRPLTSFVVTTRPIDPDRLPAGLRPEGVSVDGIDRAGYGLSRPVPRHVRAAIWTAIGRYVQRWVDESSPALDLGAGRADFAGGIRASRRIALDLSAELLAEAPSGVDIEIGDITDLSRFADMSIGTVVASNVLEHLDWPELDITCDEILRVLKPGGRVILIQPNFRLKPGTYFDNYTHRSIHTDRSLAGYLAVRGFDVEHVEGRFLPFTMSSRLSFGYKLTPMYLKLPVRPMAGQMLVVARAPRKTAA